MFTGIIEEIGTVISVLRGKHSAVLTIEAKKILDGTKVGDSIAVNGVCLTATALGSEQFQADVMHETLDRSSLGSLVAGSPVNLERAMEAGGRFGGHIVSGHIDGTGKIAKIHSDDNAIWYTIQASPQILRYIIEKGSIAIDGISLTVAALSSQDFQVSIIPHTLQQTILGQKKPGEIVNLENDCIGKYVERLLGTQRPSSRIDKEFLGTYGFL